MYAIYRLDHETSRTHAWVVTIKRRNGVHNRLFTDGVYGGKRNALMAAKAYRERLTADIPRLSRKEVCETKKKNNRSGISGVSRHETLGKTPTSPRYAYWHAQWPIGNGRAMRRKFSVKKYGEEGAFRRAVAARRRALAMLR